MASKTPQTISEAIAKLLSIRYNTYFAFKRSYDNWTLKQIWHNYSRQMAVKLQMINLAEHQKFGSDIAVSRFVINFCNGHVRNENGRWISKSSDLPNHHTNSFKLTGINAKKAKLLSEGIDNFVGLDDLEILDLSDNPQLDDFACDQLARQFRKSTSLLELNLSNNPLITVYGLEILLKIPSIKRLIAHNTRATQHIDIDLFVLAAEDEKNCDVLVHQDGKRYVSPKLEDLRSNTIIEKKKLSLPANANVI